MQFNCQNSQLIPLTVTSLTSVLEDSSMMRRFRLCDIININQTLLAFEFLKGRIYTRKGDKTVWAKTVRSEWDKRQATLQILIHADEIPWCKSLLIFQGKGFNNSALRAEAKRYDQGVIVWFNSKAYANEETTIHWLKQHYQYATIGLSNKINPRSRLLSLDTFSPQKTPRVKELYRSMNITTSFVPGGCTGFIQVLNVAINKPLKQRIEDLADEHYDKHHKKYAFRKYTVDKRCVILMR